MVKWPRYFLCSQCGAVHEIYYNDTHDEAWLRVMKYINENRNEIITMPTSQMITDHFGFSLRNAQYYLKEYHELAYNLFKTIISKGVRSK